MQRLDWAQMPALFIVRAVHPATDRHRGDLRQNGLRIGALDEGFRIAVAGVKDHAELLLSSHIDRYCLPDVGADPVILCSLRLRELLRPSVCCDPRYR